MFYTNADVFLQDYALREDESTGILLAEKQIFLPQREIILPECCQTVAQEPVMIKGGM